MEDRFDARLRAIPPHALHGLVRRISRIEGFRGWWDGTPKPAPSLLLRIREASIASSAASSTRIAGARASPASEGYAEALRRIFDGHAAMPVSEERILSLHASVFRKADEKRHAGRYKTGSVRVSAIHRWVMEPLALRPPGSLLVPAQMEALTGWLASRIEGGEFHPLFVVAAFLLEFLAIRPFEAGNGRLSRLLTNLLLLRCGHTYLPYAPLDAAIAGRWEEHYLSLRRSQAVRNLPRPDISPWLFAFLDVLEIQQGGVRQAVFRFPGEGRLSGNQAAILRLAARLGEVTNRRATRELGLSKETVKQALNRLAAVGALRRLGAGRGTRYRLPEEA